MKPHEYRQLSEFDELGAKPGSPATADCPETAIWPRLASAQLDAELEQRLLQHACDCDHCAVLLREAAERPFTPEELRLVQALPSSSPEGQRKLVDRMVGRRRTPRWILPVAACFVLGCGLVWWYPRLRAERAAQAVASAYRQGRPMAYRPAGVPYGPLRTELGGPAEIIFAEVGAEYRDPVIAANAALLEGDPKRAIAILNRSMSAEPSRPAAGGVLTDLAVAHAMLAELTGSREEFEHALGFCETELRLNPRDLAAQFNRAVILERLGRIPEARAALQKFVEQERDPGWRREAEHILQGL